MVSLDLVGMVVPMAGVFIRLGNLMNTEIIGKPTTVPWAFIFEHMDHLPRRPAQLYEVFGYLLRFALVYPFTRRQLKQPGFYFGLLLKLTFTFRFLIEFIKEVQSSFESNLPIDMGAAVEYSLCYHWYLDTNREE